MEIYLDLFGPFVSTTTNVCPFKAHDLVYTHTLYAFGLIEAKLTVPKGPKYFASTGTGINFSRVAYRQGRLPYPARRAEGDRSLLALLLEPGILSVSFCRAKIGYLGGTSNKSFHLSAEEPHSNLYYPLRNTSFSPDLVGSVFASCTGSLCFCSIL